jgi:radical SAM protein with 4Fe4S-binding SPASM domain
MLLTTLLGYVFMELGFTDANIITIYILAVLITSILTNSKVCWILFSIASVFIFNYLFTAPKFSFVAYDKGYIFTFGVMLIASLITGNIANKMKVQTKESSEVAYRTKILFETNKLLQKAENDDEIINVTTEQLKTLLKRNVYGSLLVNGQIEKNETINFNEDVLKYAIKNNLRVGATTEYFPEDKYLYIPISLGSNIYGIIIIEINETNIDLSKLNGKNIISSNNYLKFDILSLICNLEERYGCNYSSCLGKRFFIDKDGYVSFCYKRESYIGNIINAELTELISKSELFKSILIKSINRRNECKDKCSYFSLCKGGCILEDKECDEFTNLICKEKEELEQIISSSFDLKNEHLSKENIILWYISRYHNVK